jgi:hypothetical protein
LPSHAFVQHRPRLACVFSAAVQGIDAFPVEVEVNSGWGDTVVVMLSFIEVNQWIALFGLRGDFLQPQRERQPIFSKIFAPAVPPL